VKGIRLPPLSRHERALVKRLDWWWRSDAFHADAEEASWARASPAWKWTGQQESSAWAYELMRRGFPKLKLPGYWTLSIEERLLLFGVARVEDFIVSRHAVRPEQFREAGWSEADEQIQWNLFATDRELTRAFTNWIRQERRTKGIVARTGNEGRRRRAVSWRWPELLDLSRRKSSVLSDADRSVLVKANRRAAQIRERFFDAVRRARSGEIGPDCLSVGEAVYWPSILL
jgi:hypothetical protein